MPIHRCTTSDGKSGYKFGDSGHCYTSRKEALKQMRAIKFSESHGNEIDYSAEGLTNEDLLQLGLDEQIE